MITVSQTPEDAIAIQHAQMTPNELYIARAFQVLAFADRPEKLDELCRGEFAPAPVYITQAMACRRNPTLRKQLMAAFAAEGDGA